MQIQRINNSTNFKGLDIENVSVLDREFFVRGNYKELSRLGNDYDIRLTSFESKKTGLAYINVIVKPLKKGMSFFKQLFRPEGESNFKLSFNTEEARAGIISSVKDAIKDLHSKVNHIGKKL